jgi:hypothetical protein
MSMQPRPSKLDARTRHTGQAYSTTYFGKPLETGPSGFGQRLEGTCRNLITLTGKANIAAVQRAGDLTSGLMVLGLINHRAMSAGTLLTLALPAWRGLPALVITDGEALTALGPVTLDNPIYEPLSIDRPLDITIVGGSAQDFLFSLDVAPILNGWQ